MENPIEGSELAEFGFVRVDGLDFLRGSQHHTVDPRVSMLGTWGSYNGYIVVITNGGRVWMAFDFGISSKPNDCLSTVQSLCTCDKNDRGEKTAGLIFKDGNEKFEVKGLLERMSEPWYLAHKS